MLAPLEAVAVAAVAPIDDARKSANATAERAPADLQMANQQTRVRMTLHNSAGCTTLPGAVDLKTGIGRQLKPNASKPTATCRATEANPTEHPPARATTTDANHAPSGEVVASRLRKRSMTLSWHDGHMMA